MGQYHHLLNIDKHEFVSPHGIGLGLKQREHAGVIAGLDTVLYILVSASNHRGGGDFDSSGESPDFKVFGRWCGDRVVVIGDYTEDGDIPGVENASELYGDETVTDITDQIIPAFEVALGVKIDMNSHGWRERHLDPQEWGWLTGDKE